MSGVRIAIGSNVVLSTADRNLDVLVVQKWRLAEARSFCGSGTLIGVYSNLGYMRAGLIGGLCSSAIPLADKCGRTPYLPGGNVYRNTGWPDLVAADILDPTYARAVVAFILQHDPPRQGGLPDFVMFDDVNMTLKIKEPPPIPGYQGAMRTLILSLIHI